MIMDNEKDDFPVSSTDELTIGPGDRGTVANRPGKLGEFKPTNSPLSAADLKHRRGDPSKKPRQEWVPRTIDNIGELTPIPENKPAKR
jgi:hypothetical protein